jgi:hypothetical protein
MNGSNILGKKKTPHPNRMHLRLLALRIRQNTILFNEREALAQAIEAVGDGISFEEAFGVKRPAGNPSNFMGEIWASEVAIAMLPESRGGQNLGITKATEMVAEMHDKSIDLIKKAIKNNPHVGPWINDNYFDAAEWINRP